MMLGTRCTICGEQVTDSHVERCPACRERVHDNCKPFAQAFLCRTSDEKWIGAVEF